MVQQKLGVAFTFLFVIALLPTVSGQQPIAAVKHKKCKLKGEWDLVKTEVSGSAHEVSKKDFDCVIHLQKLHRYYEEVHYESSHWIIKGRWHLLSREGLLTITTRKYITGSQGDLPVDIIYELFQLDKENWAASSSANGRAVKVYYHRSNASGK